MCPRCGADQRAKPTEAAPAPAPARKSRANRPLAPLLDDDDDATTRRDSLSSEELPVGIGGMEEEDTSLAEAGLGLDDAAEVEEDED